MLPESTEPQALLRAPDFVRNLPLQQVLSSGQVLPSPTSPPCNANSLRQPTSLLMEQINPSDRMVGYVDLFF
ncbi:unnamed protein product [Protopolystoma xenopodis]|uniref:Uncharacterized protein n=1 Tax=Protopolystoma xenopodis TaxID=117903 RepID=A0A3S5FFH7_9PLAT|nr:unnamed protein product [Protopolystoma xenopodis]